jgi:hypothetical protein
MKLLSKTFLLGLAFAWGGSGVLSATVDLANGLVGHWSFDDVDGTTVKDSSGNDRHGTLVNMDSATDYVDGKVNKAIDLDGSNDYVSIPHSSAVDIRRTISVSMWVNFNQLPPNVASLFYKGNGSTPSRTYSFWAYPDGHLHLTSSDGTQQSSDTTTGIVSTGSWHHLVALIDRTNGNFKTYRNNVLVSSDSVRTSDTVSNSQDLRFGKCLESHNYLNAKLDEYRLYDRILTTDEIAYLYTSTTTDADSDGLTDAEEANLNTNSTLADTDGDGLNDGQEITEGANPLLADTDGDGLNDGQEVANGTNPALSDSDSDGLSDAEEVNGYHTYEQIDGSYTWDQAKVDTESRGGYLATITSSSELASVSAVASGNPHLGGTDSEQEGTWKWVTGETWSYSNWASEQSFAYTGSDQSFIVPAGVTSLTVKLWGAGGGGAPPGHVNNNGGAGGYTTGTLAVTPGETLTLIVGQGGINHGGYPLNRSYRYGGGASGGGTASHNYKFAAGGGRSAIRRSSTELATTGGGGGAGYSGDGGNAGGASGQNGQTSGSSSGTRAGGGTTDNGGEGPGGSGGANGLYVTETGVPGIQFEGGYSQTTNINSEAGGGGGGYFGGGGGGDNGGAAGGSGYFGGLSNGSTTGSSQGTVYPPSASDAAYPDAASSAAGSGAVGTGGSGPSPAGGNGFIHLQWSGSQPTDNPDQDYLSFKDTTNHGNLWDDVSSSSTAGYVLERVHVSNPLQTDSDSDGLTDYEEVNGYHTYEQINGSFSWTAAKADAESRGGYLATITSAAELASVYAVASGNPWLGGTDSEQEGTWKWVTGETWNYSSWGGGQPDNSSNQDYLLFWGTSVHGSGWDDGGSGSLPSYILERVFTSNPSSSDSDADGFKDMLEINVGSDPNLATSTPLDIGLTAYYPFTGNANDSSGNDYHGTVTGATLTTDRFGNANQAYSFDGSNDYISLGDVLDPGSNAITVSMWFKWAGNGLGSPEYMLFNKESLYEFHVSPEGYAQYAFMPNWAWYGGSSFAATLNQWKHITGTYDKTVQRLYENGQEVYSRNHSGDIGTNSEPFYFGRRSDGNFFNGSIDDARIYFRSLSAEEITGLYAAEMSTNSSPSDLTLSSSTIAENQSSGTVVGSFTATDPDDANGSRTYSHSLVDGNGSTDNASFTLEANGTLKTASVFDYETKTSYSIRVRVADEHNASYEEAFTISVIDLDDTAPVITLVGSATVTHEAATSYSDTGATWTDAVDGNGSATVSGTVNISVPGTYTLTYLKTDAAGNAATQVTRMVTVQDTTEPVISLTGDANVTHEAATVYADGGAAWTDTLDGNGFLVAVGAVNVSVPGTYSLSYDLNDTAGNGATQITRTVIVQDTTKPVITLTGDAAVTHEAATSYIDAGAAWTDSLDGNGTLVAVGTVNVNAPGTYVLSYDFTDAAGNAADQITRTVTMQDTTKPVITLTGDATVTHEAATAYTDAGAVWSDTLDGNGTLVAVGTVNVNVPGTYVLTYDVTDAAGNAADQVTRTVTVQDTTQPVITLTGDAAVTHEAATSYSDAGTTWADTLDGNGTLVASGTVNVNVPGTYVLTYDFTDAAGNAADQVTRTVTVTDTTIPVITLSGEASVTHEAATSYSDGGASWTDTLDGNGTLDTNGTVNPLLPGAYPLAFGVTDAAGNAADQVTRTVTVQDTTNPVITLEGNATIRHRVWRAYLDPRARASDTLDGNLTNKISTINPVDASIPGSYEVSYAVSDAAGNAATVVTRSVVVFNEAPSSLLLSNASIEENLPSGVLVGTFSTEDPDDADGSKSYLYAKVSGASLTVSTAGVLRTSEAFDFESSSSHEIVVRTTDEFGAFLEKSFTISVVDAFVPGVDTSPATEVTGTSSVLNGSIADAGDSQGVTERGFVLGRSPDPEASGGSTLEAGAGSGAFSASATNLMPGRVYYFKAYARNAEGISYGSQERFTTPQDRGSALWSAATASGANWRSSDWFGNFYLTDTPWLYHGELGWLYASGTSSSSVWLWTESLGWVWTGKETFPYLYRNFDTGWYHWNGTVNGRSLFYRYSDSQWIDFPLGGNAEAYK